MLTRAGLNTTQALARIEEEIVQTDEVKHLLDFIRSSSHGVTK